MFTDTKLSRNMWSDNDGKWLPCTCMSQNKIFLFWKDIFTVYIIPLSSMAGSQQRLHSTVISSDKRSLDS